MNSGIFKTIQKGIMTAWYPYVRVLSAAWPYRNIEGKRFSVLPGVYKPLENEHAVADYCKSGDVVLDLGCGCGVGAIYCAKIADKVLATDISAAAIRNTEENCKTHGVTNVTVRQSDMFTNVTGQFDLIIANPPYIAADFEHEEQQFATSVRYLPIFFNEVQHYLKPEGRIVVQFPLWHKKRLVALAAAHGFELKSTRPLPLKSPGLALISLAYLQVGFLSTFYVFEPKVAIKEVEFLKAA
ncbi:MAG: methyltransferase [Rhizobiaceae bacterium]